MGDLDRVTFGGQTVDRRTSNMLREAQRIANEQDPSIGKLRLSQGCFCHGVAASAGTHSGAGAFDLSISSYSAKQKDILEMSLRKVGFAAWHRLPNQGPWPEHIHGIAMGSKDLPSVAQGQVRSYLSGHNGLAGNAVDHQPRPDKILTWEQYEAKYLDGNDKPDHPAADPATDSSSGNSAGAGDSTTTADPYDIDSGQGVSTSRDSDNDGLTDDFEKLTHTNPLSADTDGNGITDGQQFVSTGGRGTGMAVDADHDGIADWLETSVPAGSLTSTSAGTGAGAYAGSIGTSVGTGTGAAIGTGSGAAIGTGSGAAIGSGIPGSGIAGDGVTGGLPAGATGVDGAGGDPLG